MSEDQFHFKANANIVANSLTFFSASNEVKINELLTIQPILVNYSINNTEYKNIVFIDLVNKDVLSFLPLTDDFKNQVIELYFNNKNSVNSNVENYLKEIGNLNTSIS